MAQPREERLTTVVKRLSTGSSYFIYDLETGQQRFEPDSPEWFTWLARHPSFYFKGKYGHFTARHEEKKKREQEQPSLWYWYAYRKATGKQHKRYLGSTDTLTLAKLEEMADALQIAAVGSILDDQVLTTRVLHNQTMPHGLTLGSVTFLWQEEVLKVKTLTGTEYFNRTQTAELLGYLYDQRESILNQHG